MEKERKHTSIGMWTVEFGGATELFEADSEESLFSFIAKQLNDVGEGRLLASEDVGERSKLLCFIFGMHHRILKLHFALEWYNNVASLIFYDDSGSEYRVADIEHMAAPCQETMLKINHGEMEPLSIGRCLSFERVLLAIKQYLKNNRRPAWLEYEYVE